MTQSQYEKYKKLQSDKLLALTKLMTYFYT